MSICGKCHTREARTNNRYCNECHNAYQRQWRLARNRIRDDLVKEWQRWLIESSSRPTRQLVIDTIEYLK